MCLNSGSRRGVRNFLLVSSLLAMLITVLLFINPGYHGWFMAEISRTSCQRRNPCRRRTGKNALLLDGLETRDRWMIAPESQLH
jgi:hypothetical protein